MSIAHNTWNLLPTKRPADVVINKILEEDQSLYEDAGEYVYEGARDEAEKIVGAIEDAAEKTIMEFIVPIVEIGAIAFLVLVVVENVI